MLGSKNGRPGVSQILPQQTILYISASAVMEAPSLVLSSRHFVACECRRQTDLGKPGRSSVRQLQWCFKIQEQRG